MVGNVQDLGLSPQSADTVTQADPRSGSGSVEGSLMYQKRLELGEKEFALEKEGPRFQCLAAAAKDAQVEDDAKELGLTLCRPRWTHEGLVQQKATSCICIAS